MENPAFKGQSAMEYLMTYGWAILIIAVVLSALLALGIFNSSGLPTACLSQPGFQCTGATYVHGGAPNGGNMIITVGQSTGTAWAQANIIFLNLTNIATFQANGNFLASNSQCTSTCISPTNALGLLNTGSATQVYLPVSGNSVAGTPVGISTTGQIWARYVLGASTYYSEIGVITVKAI